MMDMKRLLGLLLVMGMVGCGQKEHAGNAVDPNVGADEQLVTESVGGKENSSNNTAEAVTSNPEENADAVAALEKLGAEIQRNAGGEAVEISLNNANVTDADLAHLERMITLEQLAVIADFTDAGLVYLKSLTKLEKLSLFSRSFSGEGLVSLKTLTNLKWLSLANSTYLTDDALVHIKGLTKLETLYLHATQITDKGLVNLKQLTHLELLNVGFSGVTDVGLVHFAGLTNLRELDLYSNKITDAGLVHLKTLTNLKVLGLRATQITDAGVRQLTGLTNLQRIDVTRCDNITEAGVAELQKALPNCKITKEERLLKRP